MMNVQGYFINSCACSVIANLGVHKNPVDAMRTFCKTQLGVKDDFIKVYSTLANFYAFCAGPEVKKDEPGGSHHSKDHWPRYGTEFAEFIKTNGLGEVVTVGPKPNLKHHASTTAQAWWWSPNQKALEAWWDAEQAKVAVEKKTAAKVKLAMPQVAYVEP